MRIKNTALIVGAGAVENAWNPVIRAVNKTTGTDTDGDGANFLFARLIFLLRFYAKAASKGLSKESYEGMKSNISVLKESVANELKSAQNSGELRPRKELYSIVEKFASSETNKAILVSTNWDEVIELELNKMFMSNHPKPNSDMQCFHIHGSISSFDGLYLPSEITQENYRTDEEEQRIGSEHGALISLLEKSNKTVLYGISLDPLDAELNQTLAAGWSSSNIEDIIVVNPNHEQVAKRVRLLIDIRYPANIYGYHPNNLNEKFKY